MFPTLTARPGGGYRKPSWGREISYVRGTPAMASFNKCCRSAGQARWELMPSTHHGLSQPTHPSGGYLHQQKQASADIFHQNFSFSSFLQATGINSHCNMALARVALAKSPLWPKSASPMGVKRAACYPKALPTSPSSLRR